MSDDQAAEQVDDDEPVDEGAENTAAEPAEPDEESGIVDGDFIEVAYTMRTVDDGRLVDTTDREIAEDDDIDTEGREFGPRTIVVGANHVFAAVETELLGEEVGDTGTVTVPAGEAFGEYDPDQVRTVSAERIPEDQRYPGAHVNIDGQHGHIETVIGGRARVDFNHPLAGEDIDYEYEVVDIVDDPEERARGLLDIYLDAELDLDLHVETVEEEQPVHDEEGEETGTELVELKTLYIEATPQLSMNQNWLFTKQRIADELIDRLGIDRVIVRETFDGSGGMGGLGAAVEGADVAAEELVEELDADDLDLDDLEE